LAVNSGSYIYMHIILNPPYLLTSDLFAICVSLHIYAIILSFIPTTRSIHSTTHTYPTTITFIIIIKQINICRW